MFDYLNIHAGISSQDKQFDEKKKRKRVLNEAAQGTTVITQFFKKESIPSDYTE